MMLSWRKAPLSILLLISGFVNNKKFQPNALKFAIFFLIYATLVYENPKLLSSLMNALVYVNIDWGIQQWKNKVSWIYDESKFGFSYLKKKKLFWAQCWIWERRPWSLTYLLDNYDYLYGNHLVILVLNGREQALSSSYYI